MTPDDLFARLGHLEIKVTTVTHPPVFTVGESAALRGPIPGCHTKNLFLRNKKGRMFLVVCGESRKIDLKALGVLLGAGRLSFGSAERLMRYLGVIPGAVTPFAVVNDTDREVDVVLDRELLACDTLNFHPLDNTMTTAIGASDLLRFLEAEGHPPTVVDFEAAASRPTT